MNPLQKIRLLVARGVLNLLRTNGLPMMQISLLEGETREEVERVQNYGHSGHPPAGSTLVAVAVGGSRDHLIVVACEHPQYSPDLKPGESAMYAQFGQLFKMDEQGNVTLKCRDFSIEASGNVSTQAAGNVEQRAGGALNMSATAGSHMEGGFNVETVTADSVTADGVKLEDHAHSGVQSGGDNTGGPVK